MFESSSRAATRATIAFFAAATCARREICTVAPVRDERYVGCHDARLCAGGFVQPHERDAEHAARTTSNMPSLHRFGNTITPRGGRTLCCTGRGCRRGWYGVAGRRKVKGGRWRVLLREGEQPQQRTPRRPGIDQARTLTITPLPLDAALSDFSLFTA